MWAKRVLLSLFFNLLEKSFTRPTSASDAVFHVCTIASNVTQKGSQFLNMDRLVLLLFLLVTLGATKQLCSREFHSGKLHVLRPTTPDDFNCGLTCITPSFLSDC